MTCKDVEERIEAVAAGDQAADGAFVAHVETCVRCAAALAGARRIEEALAARPLPAAPPRFAAAVTSRIRRDYWRSEQQVDWMFNIAIAIALIAIAGGTLALVNLTAVLEGVSAGWSALHAVVLEQREPRATPAPAFSTYLLGAAFLVTALLVWSWAERSGRRS